MCQIILNIFLNGIHGIQSATFRDIIVCVAILMINKYHSENPRQYSPRQYRHKFRPWAISNINIIWLIWKNVVPQFLWLYSLGRRCPSINRWRVRNVRGGLRWPRWRERKYRVGIYFVFFWLKLAVFMVIRQYWKAPILYMLYEILWVVIVVPCTQKNHVLCTQLAILQSYSTTNL